MYIQELIEQEDPSLRPRLTELFKLFPRMNQVFLQTSKKGDFLCIEGNTCKIVHLMLSGKCAVSWDMPGFNQYASNPSSPLAFIGAMEVLAGKDTYNANIHVMEESRFICMNRKVFERWMDEDPKLYKKLVQLSLSILLKTESRTRSGTNETKLVRILSYLLSAYSFANPENGGKYRLPEKRDTMVENLGSVSMRTLNRYIMKIKEEGFISIEKGKITIDGEQAKRIQEFLVHSRENNF